MVVFLGGVLLTAWLVPCARAKANIGACRFDAERLSLAGTPTVQARCLLRPVLPAGQLGPGLATLPAPAVSIRSGGTMPQARGSCR